MKDSLAYMQSRAAADSRFWFPEVHQTQRSAVVHFALGLAGESGELVNLIKKANRGGGTFQIEIQARRSAIEAEMADVLIYLMDMAHELDVNLTDAVEAKRKVLIERWGEPS